MKRSTRLLCVLYTLLAVGALIATWSQNLSFFAASPDAGFVDFIRGAYANPAAASLTNDLYFLSLAVVLWMIVEARRLRIRFVWVYVVLSLVVAISAVFPVFLVAREAKLAEARAQSDDVQMIGNRDEPRMALMRLNASTLLITVLFLCVSFAARACWELRLRASCAAGGPHARRAKTRTTVGTSAIDGLEVNV